MEIGITRGAAQPVIHRIELTGATGRFTIPSDAEPESVSLDPNTWLLVESVEFQRR